MGRLVLYCAYTIKKRRIPFTYRIASLATEIAALTNARVKSDTMPVHYVKGGMKITVKADDIIHVEKMLEPFYYKFTDWSDENDKRRNRSFAGKSTKIL